jgi:hypothetical protein
MPFTQGYFIKYEDLPARDILTAFAKLDQSVSYVLCIHNSLTSEYVVK